MSDLLAGRGLGPLEGTTSTRRQGPARTARMLGSSIATPGAAVWIGDFLNAAYFARDADKRDIADLRLAHMILATRWARRPAHRLGARDLPAFHRAFGAARVRRRWRLDRDSLLAGAADLLGDWFPSAVLDARRRAHGIVFPTAKERVAFDPAARRAHGALGPLTPPVEPVGSRAWSTYPPVRLPNPDRALALVRAPARWPEFASELGMFTAIRSGGLRGQTFEIQLVLTPARRLPVLTRGYVTCTETHLRSGPRLDHRVAQLSAHVEALPRGATAQALIILTTHRGHFLGRALSHLLVFSHVNDVFVRDIGCWDPLPWHLQAGYDHGGHDAQVAFWGPEPADQSMLAQLAIVSTR